MNNNEQFKENIYKIVNMIPEGFVLTYGIIALLAGRPQNARMVGKYISKAPKGINTHRVVNHKGRTAPGWTEQRKLLERENVAFKENGCVDLKKHLLTAD